MENPLNDLGQQLLDAAKLAGANAADAMVVDGISNSIEVRDGQLEHAERAEGVEIGLRIFFGSRQACVSASDISSDNIKEMAMRAVQMAQHAPDDINIRQAKGAELCTEWDVNKLELVDSSPEPSAEGLKQLALDAEMSALELSLIHI